MRGARRRLAAAFALGVCLGAVTPVFGASPGTVTGVDLVSTQELPTELIRAALGDLVNRPRSRVAIRQSLDRLWSLGLFSEARVDEVAGPDGIRVRYHLTRRPQIRRIRWEGDLGLALVDLADAANLPLGGDAGAEPLERARQRVLAAYAREGFFAARVTVRTSDEPATGGRDVAFVVEPGPRAQIGGVTFRGVSAAEAAALAPQLRLEPGAEYGDAVVRRRVQALEETLRDQGRFEARVAIAESAWDQPSNRVNLTLDAELGPVYAVEFSGVAGLGESALRSRLTFRDAGAVDEAEVGSSAREIEAAYREAGFHFVRVGGSLGPEGDPRVVRFEVSEGPRVVVAAITFSGNRSFSAERLEAQMGTRLPGLLRPGMFREAQLDQDIRTLTAFYRGQGHPDVVVGPADVRFSDDRSHAQIVIPVVEGARLTVGAVSVEGVAILSPVEVLAALPFKVGDPWAAQREAEAQKSLGRVYARRGYLGARIVAEVTRREERADVVIRIQEGAPTRIGRILITGLVATREYVVRRELLFAPGDPFNPEALADTERRLAVLGIFERVQVGPLQPPPTPFADVEISVREGKPWRVELGAGYTSDQGWRGVVEVGHDNLAGTGQSAGIREKITQYGNRTDATYRFPWIFGTPLKSDVGLFHEYRDQFGYKREENGLAAGVERTLLPVPFTDIYRLRLGLRYQLSWVRIYDVQSSLESAGADSIVPGSERVGKVTPAVTADYRDNPLDPKTGSLHTVSVGLAGPYLGSQASFVRSQMETAWYFNWPPPTTIAVAARLGLATPLGTSSSLPSQERFYAGGGTTIRGYPQDKVGPLDANGNPLGGNASAIANAEWRVPLWRWLSGVAFLDVGAVTPDVNQLNASAFKTGVGGGLRVKTPVGPIRFDAGYALNPIKDTGRWQFYLAIGQAF
jgi:outer membrane protein insertion porin family